MGWMFCTNREGREIGYGVVAECDFPDCHASIDRGLAYVCGGMHDGDEFGCGEYFCGEHMFYSAAPNQLCAECLAAFEKEHPDCPECFGWGRDSGKDCAKCDGRGYLDEQ